jgi:DNA-binding NarL/FixJ family response regulator
LFGGRRYGTNVRMGALSEPSAVSRTPVRVAIVEDDPFQRTLAADLLGEAPDVRVVGAHDSGEAALAALGDGAAADVAIVDLCLPGIGGAEVTRRLRALPHPIEVVVLTAHGERGQALEALKAGASGYLLKGNPGELLGAVRVAAAGGAAIAPAIARYLLDEVRVPHPGPGRQSVPLRALGGAPAEAQEFSLPPLPSADPSAGDGRPALTRREREVLVLLAKGVTYEDAARVLGISLGTIQSHVKRLYRKLEVSSKAEAAAEAVRRGIAWP